MQTNFLRITGEEGRPGLGGGEAQVQHLCHPDHQPSGADPKAPPLALLPFLHIQAA